MVNIDRYKAYKQMFFGVPNNSFKLFIYLKNFFPIIFRDKNLKTASLSYGFPLWLSW